MALAITFLSDYGHADEFVGVCHGVIARLCPEARVIDVTHGIPPQDILGAALTLEAALPYMPEGVHLAVVDPGVGGERRAIALRTAIGQRLLVGPDNGLLAAAWARFGGVAEVVEVSRTRVRLEPVSATFHGRDIFAPVAAALAAGEPLATLGDPFDPGELVGLEIPESQLSEGVLSGRALAHDHFGNVMLNVSRAQVVELAGPGEALVVRMHDRSHLARHGSAFSDVPNGELLLYEDSRGSMALALGGGSAARLLGIAGRAGEQLTLRRR